MFKSGRWKGDKKIKALFGMQFQATQVPQLKAKALMISLVPADVGKPTVRLGKAAIIEGNCTWETPVYETVKLVKEAKTGKLKEKIYFLVVSSGSSKKGFLGEAYIDFADFVEATGPLMLSLPLQDSDSGAILHVTVERMDKNPEQECSRENELMDESNGWRLEMELEDCDRNGNRNVISTEDKDSSKTLPWYDREKNGDNNPPLDDESDDQDLLNLGPYFTPQKVAVESNNPERNGHRRSLTDWSSESASEGSVMEVAKGSHDNYKKDLVQELSHNNNDRFDYRIKVLERQVEVSEMEVQALRKQIVKETRKGQELSKQICSLTEERDALRSKYEHLKKSPKFNDDVDASNDSSSETEGLRAQLEEIKNELQHERHLNRSFRLRLQKSEDSNSEFILAVRDLNEKLNQKNEEVSRLSSALREKQNASSTLDGLSKEKSDQNKEMKVPVELFAGQIGADVTAELKEKIKELDSDIEAYRKDNEELRTRLEHLSHDYEILKKENDDIRLNLKKILIEKGNIQRQYLESSTNMKHLKLEVERLEEESKIWELQYLESLETIKELDSQIKNLEKELDQRVKNFEDDLEVVTRAKVELMNRAMEAEEALRRTKLDSSDAFECLQEEIKRISVQMASTIDESAKKASATAAEADDLRLENQTLEELLQKTKVELSSAKEEYEKRIAEARKEAETLQEQSVTLKSSLDEKKVTEEKFQSEMAQFRVEYDELKHHSLELKSENENLQMEVIKLQTSTRKIKEENMPQKQAAVQKSSNSPGRSKRNVFNIEESEKRTEDYKPLKGSITNRKPIEGGKCTGERRRPEENIMTSHNGHIAVNIRSNEIQSRGQAKKSNSQTSNAPCMSELLNEVEALKERNKQMEDELKEMQERYSDISLKFAEVEGERQQLVMTLRNLKNGKKH